MSGLEGLGALQEANPALAERVAREFRRKLWVPHSGGQVPVTQSDARFRILRAGRRWGKTEVAAHLAITAALQQGKMVWWVSNSEKNVKRGYRKVLKYLPSALLTRPAPSENANDRVLSLITGSKMEFYTAGSAGKGDGGDSSALTGEGVDFLVIDEAALIPESVWYQHLRPTLTDTKGRAFIISTPRGRNWFWKLWRRGQRGGEYASWHYTSFDNPTIDPTEFESASEELPDLIFQQEYLAEFLQSAASWFNVPETSLCDQLATPRGQVTVGIDLGKKEDFTVISGCNSRDRAPCLYERWNEISWPTQLDLIGGEIDRLQAEPRVTGITVAIDSTGIGDVVYDDLEDRGYDVVPVNFGGGTGGRQKELMAKLLASDLEKGRAKLYDEMADEFEAYEYQISDQSGRMKFEAAEGHDDKVSAKMLENWAVVHEGPPSVRVEDAEDGPAEPEATLHDGLVPDSRAALMDRPEVWG